MAFRVSIIDLRIRPVIHFVKRRIEALIYFTFCAYAIINELERIMQSKKIHLRTQRAA